MVHNLTYLLYFFLQEHLSLADITAVIRQADKTLAIFTSARSQTLTGLPGPRVADVGRGSLPSQTGGEKSSPWVPPASPRLAGFLSGFISVKPLD